MGDFFETGVVGLLRTREHLLLDSLEERGDGGPDVSQGHGVLNTVVAADGEGLLLGEVVGADFEAERDTLVKWRR